MQTCDGIAHSRLYGSIRVHSEVFLNGPGGVQTHYRFESDVAFPSDGVAAYCGFDSMKGTAKVCPGLILELLLQSESFELAGKYQGLRYLVH